MKNLLLILNPNAGTRQARRVLADVISLFAEYGWLSTVCVTARRGDATDYARMLAGQAELVVCAGGDGTLNETVTGMMQAGAKTPIGYLPAGSTNDFAAGLGLSSNVMTAARCVMEGQPRTLDVGRFRDRYFCYTASFGAFTQTSYTTPQNIKNVLGHAAYVLEGIKDVANIRPLHMAVEADGRLYEGDYVFGAVCNSTSLGGVLKLDPSVVDMNDGLFEALLIKNPTSALDLQGIISALAARKYENEMLEFIRASRLVFRPEPGIPWSLDGEYAEGADEIIIENVHNAITLICDAAGSK